MVTYIKVMVDTMNVSTSICKLGRAPPEKALPFIM